MSDIGIRVTQLEKELEEIKVKNKEILELMLLIQGGYVEHLEAHVEEAEKRKALTLIGAGKIACRPASTGEII